MSQERAKEIEDLIGTLPGMKKSWHKAPFDFTFLPQNEKIEVKHSGPRCIPHPRASLFTVFTGRGFSVQFAWTNIARREFQWLLLSGEDENRLYFWLLDEGSARWLMTKSSGGTITFILKNAVRRTPKAAHLNLHRITLDQLREHCEKGNLAGLLPL